MMLLWRRSREEFWLSLALAAFAFLSFRGHAPQRPLDTIVFPIVILFAWLFALDAVLDWKRSRLGWRVLNVLWFGLLTYALPIILYEAAMTRAWGDR